MTDKQKASNESPLCWVRPATTTPDLGGFQVCREGEGFHVWAHPNGMYAPVSADAVVLPEGWVLAPIEPTEEMLINVDEDVGGSCHSCSVWRASEDDCKRVWAAMVEAAPTAHVAAQAQPEIRECANGECGWIGTTDRMCGSVGPLCPDCGETTEAQAQQPVSGADGLTQEAWEAWKARAALAQQDADKNLAEMVHAMFRSGNDVPVTRITIDRKQYEAAVNAARKEQE